MVLHNEEVKIRNSASNAVSFVLLQTTFPDAPVLRGVMPWRRRQGEGRRQPFDSLGKINEAWPAFHFMRAFPRKSGTGE